MLGELEGLKLKGGLTISSFGLMYCLLSWSLVVCLLTPVAFVTAPCAASPSDGPVNRCTTSRKAIVSVCTKVVKGLQLHASWIVSFSMNIYFIESANLPRPDLQNIYEETMGSEDFSFPKVTNSTPQFFTFSPSLWRASSPVFPSSAENFFDNRIREADLGTNPSFSCPETSEEEEEVKMDVLWEDFNDKELQRACTKERNRNREAKTEEGNGRGDDNNNNKVVEICCVKMYKRGTTTTQTHHQHKRKNMGVVVKVLIRKIFSTDKKSSRRFNK